MDADKVFATWDGHPPLDLRAYVDAMLAAAWCEGRDAAEQMVASHRDKQWIGSDEWECANDAARIVSALTPPASLASALTEHVKRAVESERAGAIDAMWQVLNASRIASGWSELETQEIGVAVMDAIRARSAP